MTTTLFCQHSTYIGGDLGPDYLCGYCESGIEPDPPSGEEVFMEWMNHSIFCNVGMVAEMERAMEDGRPHQCTFDYDPTYDYESMLGFEDFKIQYNYQDFYDEYLSYILERGDSPYVEGI